MNFKLFKNLLPESKVWIFAADKAFSREENEIIYTSTNTFLSEWNSHGTKNDAEFYILYNRILVVSAANADCGNASGCSIDTLNNYIKELGENLHINFFNRLQILYVATENHTGLETNSEHVYSSLNALQLSELKNAFLNKEIDENTKIINTAVSTVETFYSSFIQPIKQSWLANHILEEV
jgi:hypothetical protein